jgi:hypothetical protein
LEVWVGGGPRVTEQVMTCVVLHPERCALAAISFNGDSLDALVADFAYRIEEIVMSWIKCFRACADTRMGA